MASSSSIILPSSGATEHDPLLPSLNTPHSKTKKPFYRARPLWLVPIAVTASLTRGMGLAPRTEVFLQLACDSFTSGHHHTSSESHFSLSPTNGPAYHNYSSSDIEASMSPLLMHASPLLYYFDPVSVEPPPEDDIDCAKDPRVQAKAAKMSSVMATTVGIISALSTGWWGQFGDRHGRNRVLGAAIGGALFTETMFLLASKPPPFLKDHAEHLLLVAPVIEGLLGGMATLHGALYAYLSDCTSHGSRARIFSRFSGSLMIGLAIGPEISALILRYTHSNTAVFYVAAICAAINVFLILFIFPESLKHEVRERNIETARLARVAILQDRSRKSGLWRSVKYAVKTFFEPLKTLAPKARPQGRGHDWSLTLMAIASFFYHLTFGMYQIKYLYAKHAYKWDAEHLSYYITAAGSTRAVYLLLIMPTLIALFKPANAVAPAPSSSETANNASPQKKTPPTPKMMMSEMKFDLMMARGSLSLDVLSNVLVVIVDAAPLFVCFSLLSAGGAGLIPAVQSIAMCTLHLRQKAQEDEDEDGEAPTKGGSDIGKLFGAFSLLQATGAMIIGPILYGTVYSLTVATYPKAIYAISACMQFTGVLLLCLVRRERVDVPIEIRVDRQVRVQVERPRGRSRQSKDISRALD